MESTHDGSMSQDAVPLNNGSYHDSNREQRSETPPTQHRRGYQACDPCRKRKVKCDLGSVDNPRPPPCVRCRRESKRCEFSATRRKRKTSDAEPEQETPLRRDKRMMVGEVLYGESPSSIGSNGKREPSYGPSAPAPFDNGNVHKYAWPENSPHTVSQASPVIQKDHPQPSPVSASHYHDGRNIQSGAYPSQHSRGLAGPEIRQHVMNKTAADLLFPTISNSHDALHLLSEAAGRTEDLNRQRLENKARQSAGSYGAHMSAASSTMSRNVHHPYTKRSNQMSADGYSDTSAEYRKQSSEAYNDPGYLDAVKAWSRLRFVRAGWLSVEEAMAYIAYYYKHLAPLSPIVIPDFSPPSTHRTLLTDEPVLAVTMLTTASRYMKPKGDGAHTRGYYIHDRLWAYLRGMIERLFWGQEKFTGNSVGMGTPRSLDIPLPSQGQASLRGHLRSLGTIEALLILTDWHPRNLHFPPGDDENTLLDADALLPSQSRNDGDSDGRGTSGGGIEGRFAFQKWLEPTWRSDRMSWMLLSTAQALAFELGVFDRKAPSALESVSEQVRKRRVRRLIIVYITQGSGRLGIPSMLPLDRWSDDIEPTTPADATESEVTIDRMQDLWVQISKIMSLSNTDLFPSKEYTSELIKTGRYKQRIAEFLPHLQKFRAYYDSVSLSPQMQNILTIEYEYTRIYVNCLALQAVVERWTTINNEPSSKSSAASSLRVLMEIYRVNEKYIQEVVDASRKILHIVLDCLVPDEQLKHCPVRTFFRILSAMIFILKTFTLGATEDDVRVSLDLQDRTIEALRTCVVDDVHLSNTISRLLELLTANIRTRFLRFAPTDRGVDGEGHERSSQPGSRVASPRPAKDSGSTRRDSSTHWQHQIQTPTHNKVGYQFNQGGGEPQQHQPVSSHHDPLAGIPAQPINSSNIGVSFMPPPPSVYYNYYGANGPSPPKLDDSNSIAQSVHEGGLPDWFALPLDQFFNSSATGVDQGLGGTGPMLGEFDMLEVLLNEQLDKDGNVAGPSGGNGVDNMDAAPTPRNQQQHHPFL